MNKQFLIAGGMLVSALTQASVPASHEITAPTAPGESITLEWTGSSLPGAHGNLSPVNPDDPDPFDLLTHACPPPVGLDDGHLIKLTVPQGAYDTVQLNFDFHIEWDEGTAVAAGLSVPDLVLSVYDGLTLLGSSDGASPQEYVGLQDLPSGSYTAVVCPFLAALPTDYRGRLTLSAQGAASCELPPTQARAHAAPLPGTSPGWQAELNSLPDFDVFQAEADARQAAVPELGFAGRLQSPLFDPSLGQPTFLWAQRAPQPAAVGPLANERELLIARARAHLAHEAKNLRLSPAMLRDAAVVNAQFNGAGPAVVRFRQRVNGLEVHSRYLNVLLDRRYVPIAVSGYFATDYEPQITAATPATLSAPQAIAAAWQHLGGSLEASALSLRRDQGEYQWYAAPPLSGSHEFERDPRSRAVYFARPGRLERAYYVELLARARANGELIAYALLVSAESGEILKRKNLTAHASFNYRVFAQDSDPYQPFDMPRGNGYTPFPGSSPDEDLPLLSAATALVSLESGPISTGDPWLAEGADTTVGNNVQACLDYFDPVLSNAIAHPLNRCHPEAGDQYGQTNGPNSFDYALQADDDPAGAEAGMAAVVSLFYTVNWLHDWWYDHGFDEASGNAQSDNYGRGGEAGDPILAQGQDASDRNNANMATPADGSSPVMQQYLFDGPLTGDVRTLTPRQSHNMKFSVASWSAPAFDVSAAVVLADEAMGPSPSDGCGESDPALGLITSPALPPQANMLGAIALIDRGSCNFSTKAQYASLSGAQALVVVNNTAEDPIPMSNGDIPVDQAGTPTDPLYQIPTIMIRQADGELIKALLAQGEVTMRVQRIATPDLDGTLDNQIIAHEFYHYVHHRLTDSSTQQTGGMSEGWGDVSSLMLSVRPDDVLIPGNADYSGAYGLATYTEKDYYRGIRRFPYSTDFAINPLTFKHIAQGEPTPDGEPGDRNSEVHAAGEIWANMLWECYAALLIDPRHSFAQAQQRMKDYIIGGLKMTPADATYTEARDAILAVAYATDYGDYAHCSAGFAKRGAGLNARSPARSSVDLVGVREDYAPFVCPADTITAPATARTDALPLRGGALGWPVLVLLLALGLLVRGWREHNRADRRLQ